LAVVEEGRDPAAEKAEKKANTFERVAEDYIRSTSRSGATRARPRKVARQPRQPRIDRVSIPRPMPFAPSITFIAIMN